MIAVGFRPYPDVDRALAQLERSAVRPHRHVVHRPDGVIEETYTISAPRLAAFARAFERLPRGGVHPLALSVVGKAIAQAGADAEATRERAAAAGPPQCPGCRHAPHAPGTECEAGVHHSPKRWHRCLCLATPGASRPCPPLMDCQGGTLGYSDVWHLRQGRSLRGVNGEIITPDVLAERPADEPMFGGSRLHASPTRTTRKAPPRDQGAPA